MLCSLMQGHCTCSFAFGFFFLFLLKWVAVGWSSNHFPAQPTDRTAEILEAFYMVQVLQEMFTFNTSK